MILEKRPYVIVSREEDVGGVVEDEAIDIHALAETSDSGVLFENNVVATKVTCRAQTSETCSNNGNHDKYRLTRLHTL